MADARTVRRMNQLRDTIAEWGARTAAPQLEEAAQAWLLGLEPSEQNAREAVGFALLAAGNPNLVARWAAADPPASRRDREIIAAWAEARLVLLRVESTEAGVGIRVQDVLSGAVHAIADRKAASSVGVGEHVLGFVIPAGGGVELEGIATRLGVGAAAAAEQALRDQLGAVAVVQAARSA